MHTFAADDIERLALKVLVSNDDDPIPDGEGLLDIVDSPVIHDCRIMAEAGPASTRRMLVPTAWIACGQGLVPSLGWAIRKDEPDGWQPL